MVGSVRQLMEKKIGEEGGARAHQSSRNRADMLVDVADSSERFLRFSGASSWKKKGGRQRTSGGFYRQALDGQLVRGDGAGLTLASFRLQREKGETVEVMMLIGGARCQRVRDRTEGTGSG
jgi:hypothetical protein